MDWEELYGIVDGIKCRATGSGMTEVTSGLDAGEQLVTVGQQYLSDGDAVRVVEG